MKRLLAVLSAAALTFTGVQSISAEEADPWQSGYYSFVLEEGYLEKDLHLGDAISGSMDGIAFSLRDMDADGIPELLMYNGNTVYAESLVYVFTYSDGNIEMAGTMPSPNNARLVCMPDDPACPGIFGIGAHTGAYWADYYWVEDGGVRLENIMTTADMYFDEESGETVFYTDPATGDVTPKEQSRTDNEYLYQTYRSIEDGAGIEQAFSTPDEIRQMGWNAWIRSFETEPGAPVYPQGTGILEDPAQLLAQVPDLFIFSSGAGAWETDLELRDDGTFTGSYHDSNMGEDMENYPGGTVYVCTFSGRFTDFRQVDEYTWSMKLSALDYEYPMDADWEEDGIHYIPSEAYGLSGGDEFLLYLEGHPTDTLPEPFLGWAGMYMGVYGEEDMPDALTLCGLYNVNEEQGFGAWQND